MQLSIIIVNYNVKYFLEQCLFSVERATKQIASEIIVVDNASNDNSIPYLKSRFPYVIFLENRENAGFSRANNQALEQAKGKYILYLNPDTLLPEDCLQKCLDFIQAQPSAGALGVRMLDGRGDFLPESKRDTPGLLTSFFKLSGLSTLFPKSALFNRYALGHLDERKNHTVKILAGAFMLVRKEILVTLGGFDEQFFMYGEDIDLSYRIWKAGYTNFYFAETAIVHFKGESTKKATLQYIKTFYGAMSLFVKKHYTRKTAVLYQKFIQAAIALKTGFSVLKLPLQNDKNKRRTEQKQFYLLGDELAIQQASRIIKFHHSPATVQQISYNDIKVLPANTSLIFCIHQFSFKESITILQKINKKIYCKWFTIHSSSIVGSHNKNSLGEVMSAQPQSF